MSSLIRRARSNPCRGRLRELGHRRQVVRIPAPCAVQSLPGGVEVRSGTCLETDNLCVDPACSSSRSWICSKKLALTIRVFRIDGSAARRTSAEGAAGVGGRSYGDGGYGGSGRRRSAQGLAVAD